MTYCFIFLSHLGDGRAIGSLCADPAVIELCTPLTFPRGNMFDGLCLIRLRPGRVAMSLQD
jgi:hypothetical protein